MNKNFISSLISISILSLSLTGCGTSIEESQFSIDNQITTQSSPVKNSLLDSSDQVFKFIDINQDKKVSRDEFKNFVDIMLEGNKDKERFTKVSMEAFDKSDLPKDRFLSQKEFTILNEKSFDDLLSGKNSISTNKNTSSINDLNSSKVFDIIKDSKDSISEKAFLNHLSKSKDLNDSERREVFTFLDSNKNKILTKDEFSLMFKNLNKNGTFRNVLEKTVFVAVLIITAPIVWIQGKLADRKKLEQPSNLEA